MRIYLLVRKTAASTGAPAPVTRVMLYQNAQCIRDIQKSAYEDVIQLTFDSIKMDTLYFLKIIKHLEADSTFEVNDLRLSSVSIPRNKPYNEGKYALLLDLYANGDMSKSQFDNWYSMLLGLQGAKYDLLGIMVKKCQAGQLSVNRDFYNYYYDGANMTVDDSVNYTVLSRIALVFLDQLRVTRSSELPYWYRIFAIWKKNIENQTDHDL